MVYTCVENTSHSPNLSALFNNKRERRKRGGQYVKTSSKNRVEFGHAAESENKVSKAKERRQ